MKKNVMTKTRAIMMGSLVAAMLAAGCELVVDFDRTKIDGGGPADGSASDVAIDTTGDQVSPDTGTDTGADTGTDTGTETGTDGGADADAHETGTDTGTDATDASDASDASDAAAEAEAEAAAPQLALTAANTGAFGNQDVGGTTTDVTFTLTNTGGAASSAVTTSITGTGPFTIVNGQDNCNGNPVAANGGTCTFKVRFTPTADGAASGVAHATASMGGAPTVNLTGTGKGLVITPASKNFMTVDGGSIGTSQVFTITNNASVTSGTLTTTPGGADVAQFTFSADTCNGQTVASTMSCTVTGNFTPAGGMMGTKNATLTVAAAAGVGGSAQATLTGSAN